MYESTVSDVVGKLVLESKLKDFVVIKLSRIDPFTKRHKLVHDGGFPKFEVLPKYYKIDQNSLKP